SRRAGVRLRELALAPQSAGLGERDGLGGVHRADVRGRARARSLPGAASGRISRACDPVRGVESVVEGGRMNRREFARLLAIGGAVPFVTPEITWARAAKLPPTPSTPDERFWTSV